MVDDDDEDDYENGFDNAMMQWKKELKMMQCKKRT